MARDCSSESETSRRLVLDAVFRLVEREGLTAASLRKVADESGVNIGSVRHYFGSHGQLMVAAAEEVGDRMERRLNSAFAAPSGTLDIEARRRLLLTVADALLPMEDEHRGELVVLLEFVTAARISSEFQSLAKRMGADLRRVVRRALELANVKDSDLEVERFIAVIDGLAFEAVYPHGASGRAHIKDVLERHIAALIPDSTPSSSGAGRSTSEHEVSTG